MKRVQQTNAPDRARLAPPTPRGGNGQSGAPNKVGQVASTARDAGQDLASQATDRARQSANAAVDRAQDVAGMAAGHAEDLVGTIRHEAGRVTDEMSSQAESLIEESKRQLEAQAEEAAGRLAQGFYQLAEEAQALADGRPADAPNLRDYVGRAADRLNSTADGLNGLVDTIEQRGIEGLVTDVQTFARRRPAAFLLGATVAGFGIGRMIRSRSADGQASTPTPRPTRSPVDGGASRPPVAGTSVAASESRPLPAGGPQWR